MKINKYLRYTKFNILFLIILSLLLGIGNLIFKTSLSREERANVYLSIAHMHGSPEGAIKEAEKAIKVAPKYGFAYAVLGDIYRSKGELSKAIESYKKAYELTKDVFYYFDIGSIYHDLDNLEEALSYYKKTIEINPQLAEGYLAVANTLLDLGRVTESKPYYDKAIEINYNSSQTHNDLGVYYARTGNMEKAKQEYEIALELDPNNDLARQNLNLIQPAP